MLPKVPPPGAVGLDEALALDEVRLLLEVEGGATAARRVQEALRAGLGIRLDVAHVEPGSLPRFELKARRVVRC
jgi:phenylacetate-CoA ligase